MIQKLIALCSRLDPDASSRSAIAEILDNDMDWKRVIETAHKEKVTPLLYRSLRCFPERVPDSALAQLKRFYLHNTGKNLRSYHEIRPILQGIEDRGLRMALTKGARLAETLYKDPGLRYFVDIDFMAHPDDLESIQGLLKELDIWKGSYASGFEGTSKSRMMWIMEAGFKRSGCFIDIHFHWPGIEVPLNHDEDLWRDVQTIQVQNVSAKVLSPEDELCIICLHAQKHNYFHLVWLTDIAEMVGLESLDWGRLEYVCRKRDLMPSLFHGLFLVERIWPDSVPAGALQRLRPPYLAQRILAHIWPADDVIHRRFSTSEAGRAQVIFLFFSPRRFFVKLRALWHILFPPQAYIASAHNIPMHSCKMYRHYIQRMLMPVRLLMNPARKGE